MKLSDAIRIASSNGYANLIKHKDNIIWVGKTPKVKPAHVVAIYKSNNSNTIPEIIGPNATVEYNMTVADNGNGTYTHTITTDNESDAPMLIRFGHTSSLLSIEELDTRNLTYLDYIFSYCSSLQSINTSNWDTRNVTNMQDAFSSSGISSLDVSNWITNNVIDMSYMFAYCVNLQSLDGINNWDTNLVNNMSSMFDSCFMLQSLDISNWNVSNVNNMSYMFSGTSLWTLDLSGWYTYSLGDVSCMFMNCNSATIDIRNFDLTYAYNTDDIFAWCSSLQELRLDNCNRATIEAIINSSNFPVDDIGSTRYIYCNHNEAYDLTPPTNWEFNYVW
jgi:surface protein